MKLTSVPLMLVSTVVMACQLGPAEAPPGTQKPTRPLLIREVTLIDGTGTGAREGVDVLVRHGLVAQVSEARLDEDGAEVLDGRGRFLVPGLVDAHTHPFPVEHSFPRFVRFGVTSILVTGGSSCDDDTLTRLRLQTMVPGAAAPRFFHTSQHFTMEGRHPVKTYPSSAWVDGRTVHYLDSVEEIGPLVAKVSRLPIVGIKVTIEDGPSPPFVERMPQAFLDEIVAQAHGIDTKVLAHVSDIEELRMADQAGIDHLLHFTGVAIDWEEDLPLVERLLARDVHWVTTLMIDKSFLYPDRPDWIQAVRELGLYDSSLDELTATEREPEERRAFLESLYGSERSSFETTPVLRKQFEDLLRLHAMGIDLVAGTDVGNRWIFPGYSLHEELCLLEDGGFSPDDLLVMATRNASELLDSPDIGTLEVGKRADMLLLEEDPRETVRNLRSIAKVYRDGVAVWSAD